MTRSALFVSPHLDDAVFSAGGTIARLAEGGWSVTVATVFTASMPSPEGFALACQTDKGIPAETDYMALRRAEDAAACAALGARALWLDLPEAPHRGYRSAGALFGPVRADDAAEAAVDARLDALLDAMRPTLVFAPAAIGGHVDHLVLRRAVERLCPAPGATGPILWRDQPYAARHAAPAEPRAARIGIERSLGAKCRAAACYTTQLGFQFGGAEAMGTVLHAAAAVDAAGEAGAGPLLAEAMTGPPPALAALMAAFDAGHARSDMPPRSTERAAASPPAGAPDPVPGAAP